MAKSRLEILQDEVEDIIGVIRHQFIERDICLFHGDMDNMAMVVDEIRAYQKRLEAVKHLLQAEQAKPEETEGAGSFEVVAAITITVPGGSEVRG